MEVKPGFHGEWQVKTLKQTARISAGINKPLSEMGSGALYVTVQDLYDGTSIRTSRLSRIKVSAAEIETKALAEGDIVLGKSSVKRDGIGYPSRFLGCEEPVVFSGFTYRARAVQGTADPMFLFYALRAQKTRRWLIDNSQSSALTNINQSIADAIPIHLPPTLAEQTAIATALSDVDALLGGLDRLIAKKRDLKQAVMQQLLTGKTRLPGFHGEWEAKTLGDLFNFSGGYSASRSQLSAEGHCYLHYGDIHGATHTCVDARADYQAIPKLAIPLGQVPPGSLLRDGDVVFVDASEDDEGTSRHVVVVNKDNVPFISGLHTIVARSKTDELAHEYRRYCFQTAAIRQQFLFYAVGKKVSGISKTNIRKLALPVPSVPEQTAIAAVLSDVDAEVAALEARRDKTRDLKQAMMQELLTGKTRLVPDGGAHA